MKHYYYHQADLSDRRVKRGVGADRKSCAGAAIFHTKYGLVDNRIFHAVMAGMYKVLMSVKYR